MAIVEQLYVSATLLAGTTSLAVAVYVFQKSSAVFDVRGLVVYMTAAGVMSTLFAAIILAERVSVMVFLLNVVVSMLVVAVLGLFHFSLAFAGELDRVWDRFGNSITALSALFVVAMWTDPVHRTFREDIETYSQPVRMINVVYGPTGQLFVLIMTVLILAVAYFILSHLYRSESLYQRQGVLVSGAVLLPLVGSYLSLVNWPDPALNITPGFAVVSGLLYAVAISRYGFLDVVPLAYEEIVESMDDYVVVTDPTGSILTTNARMKELIEDEEPAGRSVEEVPPLDEIVADGIETYDDETRWENEVSVERGPADRVLHVRSVPIYARDDRFVGHAMTLRDITELKARERELERQNERLDQFASLVSHDLRNPLNVATMRLDLAREDHDNEHLQAVEESHDRMETMISDLLSIARAETTVEEIVTIKLASVARSAWDTSTTENATLEVELPEDFSVDCDPSLLRNVFENLFRNASDHNSESITVTVGPLPDSQKGFYVEDDGTGISAAERSNIFEYGYTTDNGGTGLGLAIVKDLVEAHGWTIAVTEGSDGGARFEITTDPGGEIAVQ